MPKKYRTNVYIDGFNLYYGIKRMYKNLYNPDDYREFIWLDVMKLAESFLNPVQELNLVKYFTARITGSKSKQKRQNTYLDALNTLAGLQIIEGKYQDNPKECIYCNRVMSNPKEKQTDVNLATEILVDCFEDKFDTIILVAADSDYKAPLTYIKTNFPNKRIEVEFVEENFCYDLNLLSHQTYVINRNRLSRCQLKENITTQSGYVLKRPTSWCKTN